MSQTDLRSAASAGDLDTLKSVTASGSVSPLEIQAAFTAAAAAGQLGAVGYLTRGCGARIAAEDNAALIAATSNGHLETVVFLHEHGADLLARAGAALQVAAANGHLAVVRYLHQNGLDPRREGGAALGAAAAGGHLEVVRYLHQSGVDLHSCGGPALAAAAGNGHLEVVRYLHQNGVDVGAQDGEALRLAAAGRHGEIVRYLHRNGAQHARLSPESHARIQEMTDEIRAAPAVYHPSRFWEFFIGTNNTLLAWGGEDNFKRTVNQNYFNFIPTSLLDPKILNLARLWLRHRSLKPFAYAIEDPDRDPGIWFSWDETYFVFRGSHGFRLRLYKLFVGSLYEYALKTGGHGVLARLEEPELGNPIRIRRHGKLISQDLVNSVRERNAILDALGDPPPGQRPLVAELGAGYGRLGHVLLATSGCRYMVFDIPPALHVSEWYLSRLFPEKRIFPFRRFRSYSEIAEELEQADIAFFTANQLAMLPDRFFDAFATISSLHEMRREQIAHFLRLMATKTRSLIYIKQQRHYLNPHDGLHITRADYGSPPGWRAMMERRDAVNPGFFELLLKPRA